MAPATKSFGEAAQPHQPLECFRVDDDDDSGFEPLQIYVVLIPDQKELIVLKMFSTFENIESRTPAVIYGGKGVCVCDSRGRYLVALGRSWHPEEFTCSQCKKVLDEGGFFEERGSVYCTKCYDNRYAPNCAKCKKKITGVRAAPLRSAQSRRIDARVTGRGCGFTFVCTETLASFTPLLALSGNHACPEDDLPCSVLQVCSLQDSHQEPGLLHGGGRALLRERCDIQTIFLFLYQTFM